MNARRDLNNKLLSARLPHAHGRTGEMGSLSEDAVKGVLYRYITTIQTVVELNNRERVPQRQTFVKLPRAADFYAVAQLIRRADGVDTRYDGNVRTADFPHENSSAGPEPAAAAGRRARMPPLVYEFTYYILAVIELPRACFDRSCRHPIIKTCKPSSARGGRSNKSVIINHLRSNSKRGLAVHPSILFDSPRRCAVRGAGSQSVLWPRSGRARLRNKESTNHFAGRDSRHVPSGRNRAPIDSGETARRAARPRAERFRRAASGY
ncbi:hypothetical protein EVAR_20144_1 [Eumeta japonica]|uniref:Uncharacterized protein n=1 Tax=Eumeta variegata TaxID=151549 RepID=A0A4C1V4N0_EUMVA|nr:hypothetical protein EVAR_20144_1 [Eumeta japonica]